MTSLGGAWPTARQLLGMGPADHHEPQSARQRIALIALLVFQAACITAVLVFDPWWARVAAAAALLIGSAAIGIVASARRRAP